MSLKRFTDLPAAAPLTGPEVTAVVQAGVSRKTTAQDIANLAPPGPTLPLSIPNGGTGQTTAQAALDALFAAVTKGSLWIGDGTHITPLGVGADGDVLTADSGAAHGVSWQAPAAGGVTSLASPGGSITVSAPAGAVDIALNMGHINGWTAIQQITANGWALTTCDPGVGWGLQVSQAGVKAQLVNAGTIAASYQDNAGHSLLVCDGAYALNIQGGNIRVAGLFNQTVQWDNPHAVPPAQAVGGLPLSVFGAGAITQVMGNPDNWLLISLAGTDYLIPIYLP
jgi:hypothetical protein